MKDEHGQNQYAIEPFAPDGDGISDHSAEEWLHDCCREMGVNMATAMQIYAYCDEHPTRTSRTPDFAEAARKLESKFRSLFEILVTYTDSQNTPNEIRAAIKMAAREAGFYYLAGGIKCSGIEVAELALHWKMDKQMLNKMAKTFTAKMKMAGHPNQRSAEACKNMKQARINQIKK